MFEAHFQTFEEPESGVALTARLAAFREELLRRQLTGFVIPRADQQQNEYVAPSEERLAWLTGFTGSAGLAIVLTPEAAGFVGGRANLQGAPHVATTARAARRAPGRGPTGWGPQPPPGFGSGPTPPPRRWRRSPFTARSFRAKPRPTS